MARFVDPLARYSDGSLLRANHFNFTSHHSNSGFIPKLYS
ncbi:protein of unknown function [Legionella micdadei]|uniref:Uncharacterized protein n=1 Tax=Legionella micdadei TaxID=451 RepID=A0A098GGK5_LEGMI|nr:protein of unknown function [Legionella micdadei]